MAKRTVKAWAVICGLECAPEIIGEVATTSADQFKVFEFLGAAERDIHGAPDSIRRVVPAVLTYDDGVKPKRKAVKGK